MAIANQFVQEGKNLDWLNNTEADVKYKEVIASGGRIFIALEDIPVGKVGSVHASGVWDLPADNTVAFNTGDELYWDNTTGKLTKTTGTYLAGYAAAPKAQASTTAQVKID